MNHPSGEREGEDTPTDFDSSYEEEEEGEVTLPTLSPSCPTPLPFGDIAGRQVGITIGGCV
jgi:hypothetical protein